MTRGDKAVFAGLMIASALALLFTNVIFAGGGGEFAVVEVDGKEYGRYELNPGNGPKVLELRTEFGYNKIELADGCAKITDADCGDKLCVRSGGAREAGSLLVCLPNRLVVRIEGKGEVDGVAY